MLLEIFTSNEENFSFTVGKGTFHQDLQTLKIYRANMFLFKEKEKFKRHLSTNKL